MRTGWGTVSGVGLQVGWEAPLPAPFTPTPHTPAGSFARSLHPPRLTPPPPPPAGSRGGNGGNAGNVYLFVDHMEGAFSLVVRPCVWQPWAAPKCAASRRALHTSESSRLSLAHAPSHVRPVFARAGRRRCWWRWAGEGRRPRGMPAWSGCCRGSVATHSHPLACKHHNVEGVRCGCMILEQ